MSRQDTITTNRYFEVMKRHGLLRADVPHIEHAMRAASLGFYMLPTVDPESAGLDLEARADALARTIRDAFEPPGEPRKEAMAAAAAELCALFEDLVACYRGWIYSDEPG